MPYRNQVALNLPSKDLDASARFATGLGLTPPKFSAGFGAMFQHGEHTMIFFHDYKTFGGWLPADRKISDATAVAQVVVSLTAPSREKVDGMIEGAIKAGGKIGPKMVPNESEYGMYSRSVEDPDGHLFEVYFHEHIGSGSV
ncbi:Glyoxalase/Bleomycin resistance protein/Dihydroxybiphenyl dioxygenase [Aspergillus spectabilis]